MAFLVQSEISFEKALKKFKRQELHLLKKLKLKRKKTTKQVFLQLFIDHQTRV